MVDTVKNNPILRCASLLAALLFLFVAAASAQDDESLFYVDVSPRAGSTDETYMYSIAVDSRLSEEAPVLVGGEDFQVQLTGESAVQIIRGTEIVSQVNYNYRLIPKREGLLETPTAEVEANGRKYTAGPLKVKIDKGLAPVLKDTNESVFLRQSASPAKVYIGQQVVHSLSLYHEVSLHNPKFSDSTFDGFWNEALGKPVETMSVLNGRRYRVVKFEKALFPQRTGQIEIPPGSMSGMVQQQQRSRGFPLGRLDPFDPAFDAFFGNFGLKEMNFTSNPSTVEVLPLPPAPADLPGWNPLSPLVGATSIKLSFDPAGITSGGSKTVTAEITSFGNLNPLQELPLAQSPDYNVYTDEVQTAKDNNGGQLQTRKLFRFSLVPLRPGELKLTPLKISYFDPSLGEYKVAQAEPVAFQVNGPDLRSQSEKSAPIPQMVITPLPVTPPQVSPYAEPTLMEKLSSHLSLSLSLLICTLLTIMTIAIALVYRMRVLAAPLKRAWGEIDESDGAGALLRAVKQYLNLKLTDSPGSFSSDTRPLVEEKVRDKELRTAVLVLLDGLESHSFSGKNADNQDLAPLKRQAKSILSSL